MNKQLKHLKEGVFALLLLFSFILNSQTFPYGINYQGVARDGFGNAQQNIQVPVQFTIIKTSPNGTIKWQERQLRQTNSMGQFNAVIGKGTPVSPFVANDFRLLDWPGDSMFLKVEINQNASFTGTFATIGTQKFQAVPYAIYARAVPPSVQRFTVGAGTYNTPSGVSYIKVRMVGGGGGASAADGGTLSAAGNGGSGGATIFGSSLLIAGGGGGGTNWSSAATGGTFLVTGSATNIASVNGADGNRPPYQGSGSSPHHLPGGSGASSVFGGAGASGDGFGPATSGKPNSGSGGGGGGLVSLPSSSGGQGGAAGAYVEAIIMNPLPAYSYSVGTGGLGAGSGGTKGGNGGSGVIIVEEYY